ncbi:hypothetical protein K7X08_029877 [Anisodus acutangulus]|uniref:RNase H type-1 domain-containing protein n=1 Tax=Anisodus acutangulus TaxID=402998 RepID=A0A9Q1RBE1_9SOLA|nr:hypothetical protein K7X08_029877 [Anisodus acutangulus]
MWRFSYRLDPELTNNKAEYDALIIGLKLLVYMKDRCIKIRGDYQLVIKQLAEEYDCKDPYLLAHHRTASRLLSGFAPSMLSYVPRGMNVEANDLAQEASGFSKSLLTLEHDELPTEVLDVDQIDSWRQLLIDYLKNPSSCKDLKVKRRALMYVLIDDDIYKRSMNGVLLKCIAKAEALRVMGEVHEEVCGAHRARPAIKWLIYRHGYYWPTITADYFQGNQGKGTSSSHLISTQDDFVDTQHFPTIPLDLDQKLFSGTQEDFNLDDDLDDIPTNVDDNTPTSAPST